MVELEMAFAELQDIIHLAEKLLKYVINYTIENNYSELLYLEKHHQKKLIEKLKNVASKEFCKITYQECLEILKEKKKDFVYQNIKWGMDLQSEHEKYLCQHFGNSPIFVLNYPRELKAFYMKDNSDGKTVSCLDLLLPEIGELIGGSSRENDYEILIEKAKKIGLDTEIMN